MCFGLVNAPATFQRAMDTIFKGLEFVVVYLDDVLVMSRSGEEHIEHLKIVFAKLREYNIKLRIDKCNFFKTELKYLGFKVNKYGSGPDPEYVNKCIELKKTY